MKKGKPVKNDFFSGLAAIMLIMVTIFWSILCKYNLLTKISENVCRVILFSVSSFLMLAFLSSIEDMTAELPIAFIELFKEEKNTLSEKSSKKI